MSTPKVFGVGFHRSGTTTLQTALEELGYRVIGMRDIDWDAYDRGDFAELKRVAESFDGFRDMPWPLLYQWLSEEFPDAKFVLTYRSPDGWLRSCRNIFKDRPHRMFPKIYGVERFVGNEKTFKRVYMGHVENVRRFFANDARLLEVDWTRGDAWPELCEFLGAPLPSRRFPHANKGTYTIPRKIVRRAIKIAFPKFYRRTVQDKLV